MRRNAKKKQQEKDAISASLSFMKGIAKAPAANKQEATRKGNDNHKTKNKHEQLR